MYATLVAALSSVCRIPPQPSAPFGDEATTVVFRASPRYLRYMTLLWALAAGALALGPLVVIGIGTTASFSRASESASIVLAGLFFAAVEAVFLGIGYLKLRLDYEYRWYVLTDRSLRVREGVFIVREMTITFANVQNLSVEQGPLQRAFRIADVKVDTAGGGGGGGHSGHPKGGSNLHTARLKGVDNAHEIRELIQRLLQTRRDAGLGDVDDLRLSSSGVAAESDSGALGDLVAEARALRLAAEALR